MTMSIFRKKHTDIPAIDLIKDEPVLRCSICSGERTLCITDRETGSLHELMLIRSRTDLEEICDANGIDPDSIRKIY